MFVSADGCSSLVSVSHLFVSFFLALLPHQKGLVQRQAVWGAVTKAIDDARLTSPLPSTNSECVTGLCNNFDGNGSGHKEEEDFVFAILKLRGILDKLLNFCDGTTTSTLQP